MAIDSALKRKAVSGVVLPFLLVGITPNASEPVAWRQAAGWSYSGIETVAAVAEPGMVVVERLSDYRANRLDDYGAQRLSDYRAVRIHP